MLTNTKELNRDISHHVGPFLETFADDERDFRVMHRLKIFIKYIYVGICFKVFFFCLYDTG